MSISEIFPVPSCFINPDGLVGQSKNTNVYSYKEQGIVVKCDKPGAERVYPTKDEAVLYINKEQAHRRKLQDDLAEISASPSVVPDITAVIHKAYTGEVSYTEVQEWFENGETLQQKGTSVLTSSDETCSDLQKIFKVNIDQYKRDGNLHDINGSRFNHGSTVMNAVKLLFPLFNAMNVMIDSEGRTRFVDTGLLDIQKIKTTRSLIRHHFQFFGSVLSLGILKGESLRRNVSKLFSREKN